MLELIAKGKELMIPLLACSLLAISVIVDRAWAFWRHRRVDNRSLRAKVLEMLSEGKVGEAARICASTPGPISAVLLSGLQSYDKHRELENRPESITSVMEKAMDDYAQHAMSHVEKRFNVLATIATAAPLLGMTGTVTGMIRSFEAMYAGGVSENAVALGISEALITTATGLIVALIAKIPHDFFQSLADRIDLEIEESTSELLDHVATAVEPVRSDSAG